MTRPVPGRRLEPPLGPGHRDQVPGRQRGQGQAAAGHRQPDRRPPPPHPHRTDRSRRRDVALRRVAQWGRASRLLRRSGPSNARRADRRSRRQPWARRRAPRRISSISSTNSSPAAAARRAKGLEGDQHGGGLDPHHHLVESLAHHHLDQGGPLHADRLGGHLTEAHERPLPGRLVPEPRPSLALDRPLGGGAQAALHRSEVHDADGGAVEDPHHQDPAVDEPLDEHLVTVAERLLDARLELELVLGQRGAHRQAGVGRRDDHREAEGAVVLEGALRGRPSGGRTPERWGAWPGAGPPWTWPDSWPAPRRTRPSRCRGFRASRAAPGHSRRPSSARV